MPNGKPKPEKAMDTSLKAVDFFCGAGGMTHGLARSGIHVLGGVDNDFSCKETYEHNNAPAKFLHADIIDLDVDRLASFFDIAPSDDRLIFVGCSPCQFWSNINTIKSKSEKTAYLLKEFQRFIDHFNPGYVVIENVPGLLTKTKHTILPEFTRFLKSKKYSLSSGLVHASKYGVPQHRRRFLLLASRVCKGIQLPPEENIPDCTVRNFIGTKNGFEEISAGRRDPSLRMHTACLLSENNLRRISATPKDGGDRSAWKDDPELQIPAYKGKDDIFRDVYGRMWWDRPAPTITTRFASLSNGRFGHPEENRAISLREGATLQTFPRGYCFLCPSLREKARLIGNAVPPAMAESIGKYLIRVNDYGNV